MSVEVAGLASMTQEVLAAVVLGALGRQGNDSAASHWWAVKEQEQPPKRKRLIGAQKWWRVEDASTPWMGWGLGWTVDECETRGE